MWQVEDEDMSSWNAASKAVERRIRTRVGLLVLTDEPAPVADDQAAAVLLAMLRCALPGVCV